MVKLYAISGAPGVGKSCVLSRIAKQYDPKLVYVQVKEPTKHWTTLSDICTGASLNMLTKLYTENEFAFKYQTFIQTELVTRIKSLIEQQNAKIIITERSIFEAFYVFGILFEKIGRIDSIELTILYEQYNALRNLCPEAFNYAGMFYLSADLNTIENRVRKRNREQEKTLDSLYLSKLIDKYGQFAENKDSLFPNIVHIDANQRASSVFKNICFHIDSIISKL